MKPHIEKVFDQFDEAQLLAEVERLHSDLDMLDALPLADRPADFREQADSKRLMAVMIAGKRLQRGTLQSG